MNAPATPVSAPESLRRSFEAVRPRIERHGRVSFRDVRCPHRRADAVAETVALAWLWFVSLARRGKDAARFPMAVAAYAARAVRSGRRLCGQERSKDVLSPLAQRRRGFAVVSLPGGSSYYGNVFDEALADNTQTPVPEQAGFRLDFPAWLGSLGDRNRRIAEDLALGHGTGETARKFGTTPGRISQLRRAFHDDWGRFCGDGAPA